MVVCLSQLSCPSRIPALPRCGEPEPRTGMWSGGRGHPPDSRCRFAVGVHLLLHAQQRGGEWTGATANGGARGRVFEPSDWTRGRGGGELMFCCSHTCCATCGAICSATCSDACSVTCGATCSVTCSFTCCATCNAACRATCSVTCCATCRDACRVTYGTTCSATCNVTCSATCYMQ